MRAAKFGVAAAAVLLLLAAAPAGGFAAGITPVRVEASGGVEATITQLEHEWTAAIVNKDVAALERLLSDEFNGTSPTAHTYPKTVALRDLTSGKYAVESMVLDEVTVNVYGDVAVAFTSQNEKSRYEGNDISGHYHFTDVWVKKGGRWQVVASHGSRFNETH
jgi:ketosteroid isomerase-like protein